MIHSHYHIILLPDHQSKSGHPTNISTGFYCQLLPDTAYIDRSGWVPPNNLHQSYYHGSIPGCVMELFASKSKNKGAKPNVSCKSYQRNQQSADCALSLCAIFCLNNLTIVKTKMHAIQGHRQLQDPPTFPSIIKID